MVPGINTRCDVGWIYEVVNIKTTPILTNVPNSPKVTLVFQLVTSRFPNTRFAYTNKSNGCTHLLFLMFRKNLQVPVTLSFNGVVFTGEEPLSDFKTAIDTRLTAPVHPEAATHNAKRCYLCADSSSRFNCRNTREDYSSTLSL